MKKIFLLILSMIIVFLGVNNVSAGYYYHTCGITIEGDLKCWGENTSGKTNVPAGYKWKSFDIGGGHTCGITIEGDLKCWGDNYYGQINVPTGYKWKVVTLGSDNTCGITNEDELKCWGYNTSGQTNIPAGYKWSSINIGDYNACGITNENDLKCWGYNKNGQTSIPTGYKWKQVTIGNKYICGITNENELKCWGYKGSWETTEPIGYKWKKNYSNGPFTCGITSENDLKCWGYSYYGQTNSPEGYLWKKITKIGTHSCGITSEDKLICWGENFSGQTNVPEGYLWKDVYNGLYYTCGITSEDELKCWGDNFDGQLNNIPVGYKWLKFVENTEVNIDISTQIPTPTNLNQYIKSPLLEQEEITPGSKIGKFQSGSGVIFETEIDNPESKELRINLELYKKLETTTKYTYTSDYFTTTGKVFTKIPLEVGDYYWKLKIEDIEGNASEIIDFENNGTDNDFSIFEGFEPYPYGFSFVNSSPSDGLLSGGIIRPDIINYGYREKIPGNKWDIFNLIYPEYNSFPNENKMFDAFTIFGLNEKNPSIFYHGNCHGLATIATTYKKYPEIINEISSDFLNNGTIFDNMKLSTDDNGKWNIYDENLKTILFGQLSQNHYSYYEAKEYSRKNQRPIDILNELRESPDKSYILSFAGAESSGSILQAHAVVPYKVEGNKIYIWDNNVPYPNYSYKNINYNAYEQYIEVYGDGKNDFKIKLYSDEAFGWNYFTDMYIVDLETKYGKVENNLIGFRGNDTLYALSGNSDIIIKDDLGRITGFINGQLFEEIPGTTVILPIGISLETKNKPNTWKQIYLPQKLENLSIEINGKTDENYDLMIAGGDYYTKLEGITTSSGQIDTFNISRENLKIDFDDTKTSTGTYNILVDDFQNNGTGSIYIDSMKINTNPQQYNINWTEVINNTNNAVNYQIDTNSDGIYDINTNFSPIYQDNIAPTTTYNLIGTKTPNTTNNSYIETVNIELNSIDNENGTGVEKIYYSLDNLETIEKVYLEYNNQIEVNGVGNYTLSFYSVDKFGNKEEIKTINFILTEKPETYAGKISGYIYDDSNKNTILDTGEKTMAGWKVCIDKNNNNDCEENTEPFNVTNNNGYYEFDGLITGTYIIKLIPHQNWEITNPIDGKYILNLANGQIIIDKNFGSYKIKGGKK